jgi:hypothetical protein
VITDTAQTQESAVVAVTVVPPVAAASFDMLSGKDWGDMVMYYSLGGGAAAYFIAPLAYDGLGKR